MNPTSRQALVNSDPPPPGIPAGGGLSMTGLEQVYDRLATGIDQAGSDKALLFLVKLALLQAEALADADRFQQQVDAALRNL